MGWKNVKQHYRIGHLVHLTTAGLCIGSQFIPEAIIVGAHGEILKRYDRADAELARYQAEIDADAATFVRLMSEPDCFDRSVPVYSFRGSQIIEKQCEDLGWPHVTHDGELMYENGSFPTRDDAIRAAKADARSGITGWSSALERARQEVARVEQEINRATADLALLDTQFPDVVAEAD